MRFQPSTMSSGWKKADAATTCPSALLGALRYHSSLKAATVQRLSNPDGTHGGAGRESRGLKRRAWLRPRLPGGRSPSVAWSPNSTMERPSDDPLARQSIHATEY